VTEKKVADNAITSTKITDGQVIGSKIAGGSVDSSKVADGAISGSKILDHSITTSDIAGADVTGSISGSAGLVAANSCSTTQLDVAGAEVGDVLVASFVGSTPVPGGLEIEPLKVSNPGTANFHFCNLTNSPSVAFTGVGIRIIALR
jgi:hypothetical protein